MNRLGNPLRSRPATLAEVAERAGVSRSLASLALRGEAGVRPEKRALIQKVAEELNYYPNLIARNLASAGVHSIGLVVGQILNPLQAQIVKEIDLVARSAGFDVLLSINADTDEAAEQSIKSLIARRVSGVILVGAPLAKPSIARVAGLIPVTYIGRLLETVNVESVSTDDIRGAGMAVDHLVSLGHSEIVHIDGGQGPGAIRRRDGYTAAMRRNGLERFIRIVDGAYTLDAGAKAAAEIFRDRRRKPTAIFAANDLSAVGVMSEAHKAQRLVPEDVSVVGYGDIALAETETLSLTTVRQPALPIAAAGVESLIARIGDPSSPVAKRLIEPVLVRRGSTGAAPPSSPPLVPSSRMAARSR